MFFRFAASLVLIVMVSMAGVQLENRTLELRRAVSRQYFQTDLLIEQQVQLRLETQRLTAPAQLGAFQPDPDSVRSSQRNQSSAGALARSSARSAAADSAARTPPGSSAPRSGLQGPPEASAGTRLPLLRFQYPLSPEGID